MLFKMSATASAILLSLALAVPAGAEIIMIDDFTADTLNANWVQSNVVYSVAAPIPPNNGGTYVPSTNIYTQDALTIKHDNWYGSKSYKHDVFLRDDYSLGVGETLITDILSPSSKQNSGLMIATSTGITNRNNIMYISWNQIQAGTKAEAWYFKNDGTYTSYVSPTTTPGISGLYITRTSEHDYALGYYLAAAPDTKVELTTYTVAGAGNLDPGAAIGYYINSTDTGIVTFDNLRKEVVPEPSTLALLAAGLIGLLAYAWRKRK